MEQSARPGEIKGNSSYVLLTSVMEDKSPGLKIWNAIIFNDGRGRALLDTLWLTASYWSCAATEPACPTCQYRDMFIYSW
jgi:hypothetical protein